MYWFADIITTLLLQCIIVAPGPLGSVTPLSTITQIVIYGVN